MFSLIVFMKEHIKMPSVASPPPKAMVPISIILPSHIVFLRPFIYDLAMILKSSSIELEISPHRFERIYLDHLSTESHPVYQQAKAGQTDFTFREARDNWINLNVALTKEGQPKKQYYIAGALLPGEAYEMYEWLRDIAKGEEPLFTSLMFCEPDFQHIFMTSSTKTTVSIRLEFGVGGPPIPNLELEIDRGLLLQAAEELKVQLLEMFHKYGYPLDLIGS